MRIFSYRFACLLIVVGLEAYAADSGQTDFSGIDGQLTPAEKAVATLLKMSRGGAVYARLSGDILYAAIESPVGGFGNVCIGSDRKVRLLHASAALGDVEFERSGSSWVRMTSFNWVLRDSSRVPAPTAEDRKAHFESRGWLANARNAPTLVREFLVRVQPDERYVAFSFVETAGRNEGSMAPAALNDGCADARVMQGALPETASFRPSDWVPLVSLRQ